MHAETDEELPAGSLREGGRYRLPGGETVRASRGDTPWTEHLWYLATPARCYLLREDGALVCLAALDPDGRVHTGRWPTDFTRADLAPA